MSLFTQPYHDAVAQLTGPGAPFEVINCSIEGLSLKAFSQAHSSLSDYLNSGRQHGDKLLLQYQESSWSFKEFYTAADRLSHWLVTEGNITAGTPVAIAMRNRPEWLIAFVAIINVGGIAVPLNSWGKSAELEQGLEDSHAALLICDAPRWKYVQESKRIVSALIVDGDASGPQQPDFHDVIRANWTGSITPPAIDTQSPAILLFTSGTSGRPKGVMLSHFNCCQALMNLEFIGAATYMTNQDAMSTQLASTTPPKTLLAVPLFHISGLFSQFIVNLHHGRSLYIMYKWDADEALQLVRQEAITVLMGAPVMMMELLSKPEFTVGDAEQLTNISSGGAATPETLAALYATKTAAAFPGGGWGMTETLGTGAAFTGHFCSHRPMASGFPSPIMEFSFLDEDGKPTPPGVAGEINVRSSAAIQRYHTGSCEDFYEGWLATGDVGYINEEGLLFICGRVKDMIIRGGENIYPSEIEACLTTLPLCLDAAVVGRPDPKWGEEVAAVVQVPPGTEANSQLVIEHCQQQLAAFKVPVQVIFTEKPLPRNALRKLLKNKIIAEYYPQ